MPFRLIFRVIFFVVLLVMFNPKLSAQFIQQGPKLRGTGSVGLAQQGSAIAISSDGNTAIVGGRADYGYTGAAWVFTRTAGVWSQQGIKLSGSGGIGTSSQGYSVAISSDGNTAIVGGFYDNIGTGAAWIFTRNAGVWTQQGSKLVGTGAIGNAQQGGSVSISSDGNTVVIGGSNDNAGIGAAWVFTRSAGIWSQQGSKIVGSGAVGNSEQGKVSISGDGTTLVIGGRYDNNGIGAVWIFTRSGIIWTQQGSKLVGSGAIGAGRQGDAVSLSSDGNSMILGGSYDNNTIGAVWIFTRSGTVWSQQGSKLVGTGAIGQSIQGYSVSISADGNTAITGGYLDGGGIGAAWVFIKSGSVWTQQGLKVVGTGANGNAQQGGAVSISADGNTMIVGGQYDNFSNTPFSNGASWVFTRSGGIWTQQGTKLVGSGAEGFEYFGSAVALSSDGNTAIVGGTGDNNNGAAWIFIRSGGSWSQQGSKLLGSGGIGNSIQGYSVAISSDGNTAIVGGPGDNNGIGAAWIYSRSGGVWVQQGAKLIGSGAVGAAGQGRSVSLSSDGNTAIIGGDNDNTNKGAVWIFTRSGSVWTQQGSKLVGTGGIGLSYQGNSVSISADGNSIIVGGYNDNSGLGASWIYSRSGGVWTQQGSKLVGTGAVGNPNQGFSVSMSADGNTAIVGGNTDNFSGAVWVFSRSGGVWTQQGAKLSCTGAVGYPFLGSSISLSANGNKFISAGFADNDNHGAAWIFTRTGGTWTQEGSKLVGSGNNGTAAQGWSVSLAADGNTAFVGGKEDQNGSGAAWVYNVPAPVITNFSPTSGQIGTSVTITGTGFNTTASNNIVFFGATKATVTAASETSLTVTVPTGATYENIAVTNLGSNLSAFSSKPFTVTLSGSLSFSTKQDKATSAEPYETCISDIDGDGKPDIAVVNNSSNSVSVLRNTSTPGTVSVAAKIDFTTEANPQSLTAGDIDGDGKPDLVLTNYGSNSISVLRNISIPGTASFAAKVDFSTGASSGPAAVSIGDLDADGKPDLATVNSTTNTVSVFLNTSTTGSINFASKVDFATEALPYAVSINDIDGDGKPDISVANFSGSSFSVLRNASTTGTIAFAPKVDYTTGAGSQASGICAGDLDGDGKADITVTIASSNKVSVFRNTSVPGTISFATKIDVTTASGPYKVSAGDIDGDGKPDLAVASSDVVSKVSVLRNTSTSGNISFATKVDLTTGAYTNFVSIGDIDGDDKPDIVTNNSGSNTVSILQQSVPAPAITSFTPLSGPPGTLVTITGTNLNDPTAFSIGGTSAIVVSNTGTQLVGMVMPGAVSGAVSITTASGTGTGGSNFTVTATPFPSVQQGNKLVGTGNIGNSQHGNAVAISADGNTAVVGGIGDDNNTGAVWIYVRSGGIWVQQGNKLVGTGAIGAAWQGTSVGISADGNTAIIGARQDNTDVGAAWIFTRSGGIWSQQGNKLIGSGAIGSARQGAAVSISADGNTAAVGGIADNNSNGAVWIYSRTGGAWEQQGSKLTGTGAVGTAGLGLAIALSSDGNTLLCGGFFDNSGLGAAWVFTRTGGSWSQQGSKLVGTGAIGLARQGWSVAISSNGNTAILGGPFDDTNVGASWIFTRSEGIWLQQGNKLVASSANNEANQGRAVSISADGNTAIIGAPATNSASGAAWVFTRTGNTWLQQGDKLFGTGAISNAFQGWSVSLSSDASTLISGGFTDNSIGAAWVFTVAPAPAITSFTPSSGPPGTLVTITGTNLDNPTAFTIGGASAIVVSNTGSQLVGMVMPGAITGAVSITTGSGTGTGGSNFTVTATPFPGVQQGSKLVGTGALGNSRQGTAVAVSADGNTAIIGGPDDNSSVGAAWIYVRSSGVWVQQGNKLVGTGAVGAARQGWSVAISADGNTAIVGGYLDNGSTGAAWIYTRTAGVWTQQGNKLVGTGSVFGPGGVGQGHAVSLSADGNTAVVAGPFDSNAGAIWVYTRTGGVWTQQGAKLVGTGAVGNAQQGNSVSISADGNTIVEGGVSDNSGTGATWIFTRSGGIWSQQGSKLVGTGAVGQPDQGWSVSISADGNTVISGARYDNSQTGAAWVFTRSGSVWTQQGNKLVGTDASGQALQGFSVSISADGNIAVVGGYQDNSNIGAAWVYSRSGGLWSQQGNKFVGTGAVGIATQGQAVAISADGSTAVIGGPLDNNIKGAVWIFTVAPPPAITSFTPSSGPPGTLVTITGTNLGNPTSFTIGGASAIVVSNTGSQLVGMVMPGAVTGAVSITTASGTGTGGSNFTVTDTPFPGVQQGNKLVGTGATGPADQGRSVAISADGNTAVVGGAFDDDGIGAAWIYTRSGNIWTQQGNKLIGSGAIETASQGYSVSISADGNTVLIGGYSDNAGVGAAWIFVRNAGVWTQQGNKLVGTGAIGYAYQGCSVSLSADGNTAIVGGYLDNSAVGAAWVFTRSGNSWIQEGSKLVGSGNMGASFQGFAVSLSSDGKTAVIGGEADNGNVGAAWIFIRNAGVWTQQGSKLVASGSIGTPLHGCAVAISSDGNTVIVGGMGDNANVGAAWIYTRSGAVWSQQGNKLIGSQSVGIWPQQGSSVSLSADGNIAIIGALGDNSNQGAAWVYKREAGVWSQQGNKLVGTGTIGIGLQGTSIALSANGSTAIVGGNADDYSEGAAWIYTIGTPCVNPDLPTVSASSNTVCSGVSTTLNVTAGNLNGATGWQWYSASCGGTLVGSGTTVNVSPIATTTYYVRGEGGCVVAGTCASITINVNALPTVGFTASPSTSVCNGTSVTLTGTGASSYTWTPAIMNAVPFVASYTPYFSAKTDIAGGSLPLDAITADIDGDGKIDVLLSNYLDNTISVYRNISSPGNITAGSFAAKVDFATGTNPGVIAVGDIDGDGKKDVIVINTTDNTTSVLRNTSIPGIMNSGSLAAKVDFTVGTSPSAVSIADFDGDGKNDIAVGNNGGSSVSVLRNTSVAGYINAGSFAAKVDFNASSSLGDIAVTDVDGDNKIDIITTGLVSNTISVLRNTSVPGSITAGSFAAKADFATGVFPKGVSVSDVDGDGKTDIVVTNLNSSSISVFRNTSAAGTINTGSLAAKVDFTASTPFGIEMEDIDGDGKKDVVVSNAFDNTISVFINHATPGSITTGSLSPKVDFAGGNFPQGISIGDIDGDGNKDLVVSNRGNNTMSVFRNQVPTYTVTGTAANGCTATQSLKLSVSPLQSPTINVSPSAPVICLGSNTNITAGGANTYSWSPETGLSTTTGATVTASPAINSTYIISGTAVNGCVNNKAVSVTVNPLPVVIITGLAANYCTTNAAVNLIGTPAGGIFNGPGMSGTIFDPAAAGPGLHAITYTYSDVNGCTNNVSANVTVTVCPTSSTLNLTAFLEGFYSDINTMRANIYDLGISTDPTETDTVTVNLWAPVNLSNQEPDHSAKAVIHTDGTATLQFPASVNGNPFYIAVKHRNHMETWSKLPVTFTGTTTYDFSDALGKAYDDGVNAPMASVAGGKFAFYGGDVNQDYTVDGSDANDIEIGANNFDFGYNAADANGDGETGGQDANIVEINANLFLFFARPY